ncbi:MAG: hypothetical protein JWO05_231 [Gemmatimonadetes bacterium]|nr:hypothetical protein [Gemmatimonadota bacterium]
MTTTNENTTTLTMQGDRGLHIERVIAFPRERVWKAMNDPALIAQWWGRGNKLVIEKYEPVRGGHWRFVEHSDHGEFGFEGRFREATEPSRVVQTFEWDGMPGHVMLQTLELHDLGDGRTRLTTDVLYLTAEDRDGMVASGMEGGLNQSYLALEKLLATMD